MRKEYAKALRKLFEQRMQASAFGWRLHREKQAGCAYVARDGERAFRKDLERGHTLWCFMVPHHQRESFTLEVGWSTLGRYPQLTLRPSPERPERPGELDEYVVRLSELAGRADDGWDVEPLRLPTEMEDHLAHILQSMQPIAPDEALLRVTPVLDEALATLQAHGEPWLLRMAQHFAAA